MQKQTSQWLIPVLLAVGAAGALWFYWIQVNEPVAPQAPPPPPESSADEILPGPLHPVSPMEPSREPPDLVALPPLNESDAYFKLGLVEVFGDTIENLLADSGLIERIVATVDNLPRSHVAERIRPIGKLPDQFRIEADADGNTYTISEANFERYAMLVNTVANSDLQGVIELYRRFYPLFQNAYEGLGYPNRYFNDRLVEVIDHLLATPETPQAVRLVRPHVLFEYEDEALENLSSGQKMMIRMGRDNADQVKATLRELRVLITAM